MEKKDVIAFFDRCAASWDADMIKSDVKIGKILDNAEVGAGMDVLDVACGTGVMIPYYLERGAASVLGIDISPEMARIAQSKFPEIKVICGDVETVDFSKKFDAIMVYNAFPHFPDPAHLVKVLAGLVKPGGKLSVAHGMSRAALTSHHAGRASSVSIDLLHEKELAALMEPYFDVDVIISNERMYQVAGVRREGEIHSHGGHSHAHGHGHTHSHDHSATPMEELLALMKYMVTHNDAHAQELAELADQLKTAGKSRAYQKLMDAVASFDIANAQLDAVFKELSQDELEKLLLEESRKAIAEDGAEVIVMGCCGLAGLDVRISTGLGVPVLDPVGSAVKILENLVDMNLRTSRVMSYCTVIPQEFKNVPEVFHPLYQGTDSTQV